MAALILAGLNGPRAWADAPTGPAAGGEGEPVAAPAANPAPSDVDDRLRRLEALNASVLEENRRLAQENRQLADQVQAVNRRHEALVNRLDRMTVPASATQLPAITPPQAGDPVTADPENPDDAAPLPTPNIPALGPPEWTPPVLGPPAWSLPETEAEPPLSRFLVGEYDEERSRFILVQPKDPKATPFSLEFDLITQIRYTGFARSDASWRDSAGNFRPIRNFDTIQVNRNWFQFTGYAIDPRLQFMAAIFSSSTTNDTLFFGFLQYQFSKAFTLAGGYYKLPGSREWYDSYRYTLGADRTMATTFFRPGFSPGIWASGSLTPNFHYVTMLAGSFNGLDLAGERVGSNIASATNFRWEPLGEFGLGPSDIEWHERPTPRIGTSFTFGRDQLPGPDAVSSNPENTLFRLSDGTPLSTPDALGRGVQLLKSSVQLWAIDAAVKYRGLSLSGEYFFRLLDDFRFRGSRPPTRSLFDHGGYGQASYFVIPHRLEAYARSSFVTGRFGGGHEWGGGLNWYVRGSRTWRFTFDATRIAHSPAQNELTGYRAGESGTLFQLQMLTDF